MTKNAVALDESVEDELDQIRREIAAQGARTAYEALIEVCADKKAPAQARSAAGIAILRAAGLNEPKPALDDKPPQEMTLAEIEARTAKFEHELDRARAERKRLEALSTTVASEKRGGADPFN